MTEEHVRRRRKKFDDVTSTLLLANCYFLGNNTKFILIGYSAHKDMKPSIIFCNENSFVEFTLSDWITLTSNANTLNDWTIKNDHTDHEIHLTKNITIKKVIKANNMLIQIQNNHQNKASNSIFLNSTEYNKCLELNLFIQNIMRALQANWIEVEDYYNFYVLRCNAKKKIVLEEQDFFTVDNVSFAIYRLFKEISIFCSDKIQNDVMFNKIHE